MLDDFIMNFSWEELEDYYLTLNETSDIINIDEEEGE